MLIGTVYVLYVAMYVYFAIIIASPSHHTCFELTCITESDSSVPPQQGKEKRYGFIYS